MGVLIDALTAFFTGRQSVGWKIVAVLTLALLALVALAAGTQ